MAYVWENLPQHVIQITDEPYVTEFGEKFEVGFHFLDETANIGGGPYPTAERAAFELGDTVCGSIKASLQL